jgi:hypothetical protein
MSVSNKKESDHEELASVMVVMHLVDHLCPLSNPSHSHHACVTVIDAKTRYGFSSKGQWKLPSI